MNSDHCARHQCFVGDFNHEQNLYKPNTTKMLIIFGITFIYIQRKGNLLSHLSFQAVGEGPIKRTNRSVQVVCQQYGHLAIFERSLSKDPQKM